ncbi:MAG: hypothetical protein H7249_17770 [Chitinophagaceae bacterium]|nr:hypothetical protein [Oligoflexus sp.]
MESFKKDQVRTNDGSFTIRHPVYDEEFHSKTGARRETEDLYMKASGYAACLAERQEALGVLDVGLGLGYNALMTLELWMKGEGLCDLTMLSLEHTEALLEALVAPDTAWKEGWSENWKTWSLTLIKTGGGWQSRFQHPMTNKVFVWNVAVIDAVHADLSEYRFHFIWQDAFSSKKNPELWTVEWFAKVAAAAASDVCLATYSVARLVRDNLEGAGWRPQKIAASGEKKQWLIAHLGE